MIAERIIRNNEYLELAAAAEYAEKAGYKTAMISWGGAVRKYDRDMYHVKRIMVFEDDRQ